ncbi:hypothetical protein [Streptomyces sp. RPT161]|uniref:hypothetical protein n=1 Tax=Streptomyces sp. RPT161 TaxID=3015993 RepID=UPI0022B85E04|nr:hypothetical protein [Streptomyces sp. RPT161]
MRISHLAVLTTAGAALAVGAAPAFAGVGTGQITASPTTVSVGQTVHVIGTCPNNGSALKWVGSAAFSPRMNDPYTAMTGYGGSATMTSTNPMNWSGWAKISQHAKPGATAIEARCGNVKVTTRIVVVVAGTGGMKPTPKPSPSMTMPHPTVSASQPASGTMPMPSSPMSSAPGQISTMPSGAPNTGAVSSGLPGYATAGVVGGLLLGAGGAGLLLRRRARAGR